MTSTPDISVGSYDQRSDADLAAGIMRRDQRSLEEAYRRHIPVVLGVARRVLNDAGMAEEVAQEVILRLWNEADRFDPSRGTLRSFLVRQAHSRAVERVRSEEARRRREERFDRESIADVDAPERIALGSVRNDALRAALSQLSEGERDAIGLAYFGGYSYRDVAERLGVPEGTVKSRIRLGLGKLSVSLELRGMGEPS